MNTRSCAFLWGLGYPRIAPHRRAELQGALREFPRVPRLLSGVSLLVINAVSVFAILMFAAPGLQALENFLGLPSAPHVVGIARWLAIAAAASLLVLALGIVWCAVTYAWVTIMRRLALIPELAIEAIARGGYLA